LLGHTVNSDAAYVATELAALGMDLLHVQTVGDNPERLETALREALARAEIVITTGGLGPTEDDLTKETVARVTGAPLEEHADSLARLREYFGDRPMSANQYKQSLLPHGSHVFPNAVGTAPGCAVPAGDGRFVLLLPGPPRELLPMLHEHVTPFLTGMSGAVIVSSMVKTFGIGEGDAAMRLASLTAKSNPSAATYVGDMEMYVRITAKARDVTTAKALAAPVVAQARALLGDVVYGLDVPDLETVVVDELLRRGETLATAESCTGGLLSKRLTDISGASKVFGFGFVTYANAAKTALLGVSESLLAEHGAVSAAVAQSMAQGARERSRATYGLGITGIAGPDGGTKHKPVGLVYIALNDADHTWLRLLRPQGRYPGRDRIRRLASSHALDMLRRRLTGLDVEGTWGAPKP
ncbi:MAG: competence/damage-inducible protein A, partial [Desulfovibrio sp.]|nr:competence/damage-inducible protein A [Desulfovibrio sp.]